MVYTVRSDEEISYSLQEKDEVKEILQNIRLFLSTRKGSVPMYRSFGLDTEFIDKPLPVAQMLIRSQLKEMIEAVEPRATIQRIDFEEMPLSGGMAVILEVNI